MMLKFMLIDGVNKTTRVHSLLLCICCLSKRRLYLHQPKNLPRLADDLEILQLLQQDGDVKGDEGDKVDEVHGADEKPQLGRGTHEPTPCAQVP